MAQPNYQYEKRQKDLAKKKKKEEKLQRKAAAKESETRETADQSPRPEADSENSAN